MITLGIETSCDETSVAVLSGRHKILSNVVYSSLKQHKPYGGVVPEIASRSHLEVLLVCLDSALKKAKIDLKDVDLIAVTKGPGLMGSLLVGIAHAKALSLALEKPIIGVDHVLAHAYSGFLCDTRLKFPVLGLIVSGGHTMILRMDSPSRFRVIGRTIDDAAGEAFDKVAKTMGLRYPGGPEVDRMARGQDPAKIFFKRPFLSKDSFDFSFSGIKTAVYYKVKELQQKRKLTLKIKKLICAGFQEAVCDVIVEKSLRAAAKENLRTLVVGGGVSANSRLRQCFLSDARTYKNSYPKIKVVFPESRLCQDNAAMIAALGAALYDEGLSDSLEFSGYPNFNGGA